jgi:hypothetical protein
VLNTAGVSVDGHRLVVFHPGSCHHLLREKRDDIVQRCFKLKSSRSLESTEKKLNKLQNFLSDFRESELKLGWLFAPF